MVEQNTDFQYTWQIGLRMYRQNPIKFIVRLVDLVTWAARDSNEQLALIAAAREKVCELPQFKDIHPHPAADYLDDQTPLDTPSIGLEQRLGEILRTADYIRARKGEPLPLLSVIKKIEKEYPDDPDFARVLIGSYIEDGFRSALKKARKIQRIAGVYGFGVKDENPRS